MKPFHFSVLTPEKLYYEGECESLAITTIGGEMGVLADHSNLITAVVPGSIRFTEPGGKEHFAAVSNGLLKVEKNLVQVFVDTIEEPDEIDEARAIRAAQEAKEALMHKKSMQDYKLAQAQLARAANRLKVKNNFGRIGRT
ncbi:MAG: ATP synthase F1 subunit epsilon [Firmicutes bacterium]|nr:ATP synthase F1 subunit epsilon [Bacillota bacterium]